MRLMRWTLLSLFGFVLVSPVNAASADFSGVWKGTLMTINNCPPAGTPTPKSVAATATFGQSNDEVSGTLAVTERDVCIAGSPFETFVIPVHETVSGSTLTATIDVGESTPGQLRIDVNGNTMQVVITGQDEGGPFTVSGTLTRITGGGPSSSADFSGVWRGTLRNPQVCSNGATIVALLDATATFSQTADQVTGNIVATGPNDECVPNSRIETFTVPVNGTVFGSSLEQAVNIENGPAGRLKIDVNGDTMQIVILSTDEGSGNALVVSGTLTRTSGGQPRTPAIAIGALPFGMLQTAGQSGATDSFTVTNLGLGNANVTLTATGDFFQVDPSSFALPGGATQTVRITAASRPAGAYTGSVTVSSGAQSLTVPVRLLVTAPPAAPVDPRPSTPRFEISAPPSQSIVPGFATFTNGGAGVVSALVVADVPWIIPTTSFVTIQPGQSQDVLFNIDRSKRDDGGAVGGATGALTLRYLSTSPNVVRALGSNLATGASSSAQIVDVVKATVTNGAPPPLQSGEIAFYVPDCGRTATAICDAFLSSRAASPVADLRLLLPSNGQIASIPSLSTNTPLAFPSVTRTIFSTDAATSVQIRSSQAGTLSVAASRVNNLSGALAFGTALPVLRSDRGIQPGERLVLSGLESTSTSGSTIVVQEMSGNNATVELQAYNASGAPVGGARTLTLTPFGQQTDGGTTTVAGVSAIVVRNTGSGTGRINAVGRVQDFGTNDSWVVLDPAMTARGADTLIMPLPVNSGSASKTLFVTNTSSSPIDARVETVTSSMRHRAATHGLEENTTAAVSALQTVQQSIGIGSFVRIFAPADSVSAAGRVTLKQANGASFGGALPVIPATAALRAGDTKRFTGMDDTSTTGTSLMLIETTGQKTTVQVTLRFVLIGSLATSRPAPSKTFTVNAGQMLVLSGVATSLIGPSRAMFGNLRNMQLDVQVLSGGRVIPFLQSVDSVSGDVTIRAD